MGHVHARSIASRDSTVRVDSVQITKSLDNPALIHMNVAVLGCVCSTILRAIWGYVLAISVLNLEITKHGKEYLTKLEAI